MAEFPGAAHASDASAAPTGGASVQSASRVFGIARRRSLACTGPAGDVDPPVGPVVPPGEAVVPPGEFVVPVPAFVLESPAVRSCSAITASAAARATPSAITRFDGRPRDGRGGAPAPESPGGPGGACFRATGSEARTTSGGGPPVGAVTIRDGWSE